MADIAGVNTFGFQPVRSTPTNEIPNADEQAARRAEDELTSDAAAQDAALARGVDPLTQEPVAPGDEGQDAGADAPGGPEDTVALSQQAQELSGLDADGANPDLIQQAIDAVANPDVLSAANQNTQLAAQVEGVDQTSNQQASEESTTATVNGNQDQSQSEQNRTLGQVVDQFA